MHENIKKEVFLSGIMPLLIIFTITTFFMILYYKKVINEFEHSKTEEIKKEIEIATKTYQRFADYIYDTRINKNEIAELLYNSFYHSETKDRNRIELKSKIDSLYTDIQKYEFRQLHFHLPDTESFLRMHRPSKYGDKLAQYRATVRETSSKKTASAGFEEGRIVNGYRYVYPLFYTGKYAGSVEISISFKAVIKSLEELFDKKYIFILKKEIVDEKVFLSEKSNYRPFCVNRNYLLDIEVNRKESNAGNLDDYLDNTAKIKLDRKLDQGNDFIQPAAGEKFKSLFVISKILNFSKTHVGFLISIEDPGEYIHIKNTTLLLIVIISIIIVLIYILIQYHIWVRIKFEKMAMHDKLTTLYNREMFLELFRQTLTRMKRFGTCSVIIMADIDRFKKINDKYGHNAGDSVLKTIAEIIKTSIRESDISCRWGGEEFIILLPRTDLVNGIKAAEKIRSNIEQHKFGNIDKVTCSFGVAEFTEENSDITAIVESADKMLYKSKKNGRNRVEG